MSARRKILLIPIQDEVAILCGLKRITNIPAGVRIAYDTALRERYADYLYLGVLIEHESFPETTGRGLLDEDPAYQMVAVVEDVAQPEPGAGCNQRGRSGD